MMSPVCHPLCGLTKCTVFGIALGPASACPTFREAPVICLDVPWALSLQTLLGRINQWITQLLGHSGFSPASEVAQPLGISLDFSPNSACGSLNL